jgi:hypothetical protein
MKSFTNEIIRIIGSQVHPGLNYHSTSLAYIRALVQSYIEVLDPAPADQILQWIPMAFSGILATNVAIEFNKAVIKYSFPDEAPEITGFTKIQGIEGKNAIIEYIIAEIMELSGTIARGSQDTTVLPWDIQKAIATDPELSLVFGITLDQKTLPITVTIGPQQFTHMLSMDFTIGLLLFSDPTIGNHDFHIMMFDVPFTSTYLFPDPSELGANDNETPESRYRNTEFVHNFSVSIGYIYYGFDTPDFMQGFATGAMWANVDHHLYWKDLTQYVDDEDNIIPMLITF